MKIEAKKSRLNLTGSRSSRPGKVPARESRPKPEKPFVAEPRRKPPEKRIPQINMPRISLPNIRLPRITMPMLKKPDFNARKPGPPKSRGSRSKFVILVLAAIPALAVALWLGMNLRKHPVPEPLFTEGSLPPLPPADANGYAILYNNGIYNEYSPKDLCDINLLRNASSIESFLDRTRGEYTVAKNLAGREDVKKMLGIYRNIMKKEVFADMAVPVPQDLQKARVYIAMNNSLLAAVVVSMQQKKYGDAFRMMKDALDLNRRYIQSARSMNNYNLSMQAYDKSLDILKSMLAQFGDKRTMGNDAVAICRETGTMLSSFNPQSIPLDRIVMFEYILSWKQTFSPAIRRPEAAALQGMKRKALVFFDRGLTQKLYDERWKKLYDLAKQPGVNTPEEVRKLQEQRHTAGRFWWLHNAVGKHYLDTIPIPVHQLFQESKNWSTAISRKQGDVLSMIGSLKEEAVPEKKPARKQARKEPQKPVKKPNKGT